MLNWLVHDRGIEPHIPVFTDPEPTSRPSCLLSVSGETQHQSGKESRSFDHVIGDTSRVPSSSFPARTRPVQLPALHQQRHADNNWMGFPEADWPTHLISQASPSEKRSRL
jgi:hypothetical protein